MRIGPWSLLGLVALGTAGIGGALLALSSRSTPAHRPGYAEAVRGLDDWVDVNVGRSRRDPRSWLALANLGEAYRQRALLTGDELDLGRAERSLEDAFIAAPGAAGPWLARAKLSATLHRWNEIERDLAHVDATTMVDDADLAGAEGLRAERAFQRGDYARAIAGYRRAAELDPGPARLATLASGLAVTGGGTEAEILFSRAEAACTPADPVTAAWVELERANTAFELEHFDEALTRATHAEQLLPGWWRARGRIADARAALGQHDAAITDYRGLIARTQRAEYMDALARELRVAGDPEADRWIARAGTIYDAQLATDPEAAWAHAFQHFLDFGDPQRALDLAERDHALRPGGETTLRLALADLRASRLADARTLVDALEATPWDVPRVGRAARLIHAAGGGNGIARGDAP
jgi:tetratricopeptide (TPR) repeat protein